MFVFRSLEIKSKHLLIKLSLLKNQSMYFTDICFDFKQLLSRETPV